MAECMLNGTTMTVYSVSIYLALLTDGSNARSVCASLPTLLTARQQFALDSSLCMRHCVRRLALRGRLKHCSYVCLYTALIYAWRVGFRFVADLSAFTMLACIWPQAGELWAGTCSSCAIYIECCAQPSSSFSLAQLTACSNLDFGSRPIVGSYAR